MKDKILTFLKSTVALFRTYKTSIIVPTVVMVIISLVVTLALSVSNLITEPKIAKLTEQNTRETLAKVMPAEKYAEKSLKYKDETYGYTEATKSGKTLGYIFTVNEKGYGGEITVMVAVNVDCTLKAVEIIDATSETVGLGQKVTEESFLSQFKNIKNKTEKISVNKNTYNAEKNEIKAVTGATISSKSVTRAVNKVIDLAKSIEIPKSEDDATPKAATPSNVQEETEDKEEKNNEK